MTSAITLQVTSIVLNIFLPDVAWKENKYKTLTLMVF